MEKIVFAFVVFMLGALMFCGVLSTLRRCYWSWWRILLLSLLLAAVMTAAELAHIDMEAGLNIVCATAALVLLYREDLWESFFDAISGAMTCWILQWGLLMPVRLIVPSGIKEDKHLLIFLVVLTALIFHIHKFTKAIAGYYLKYKQVIWAVFLNFYLIRIAYLYNWDRTSVDSGNVLALMIIAIGTNLVLVNKIIEDKKQEEHTFHQRELMESKETFIKQMAARQHEFSRHIQLIRDLAELADSREAVEQIRIYTDELILEKNRISSGQVYAGDSILTTYLEGKKKSAAMKGVELDMLIRDPLPEVSCSHSQLVEITGNLLDNAVEAAAALETEKRDVYFEIGAEKGKAFFQTMNHLPETFDLEQKQMLVRGFSTKAGELRGHGLANVEAAIEQYQGKLILHMDKDVIIVKVLL